MNAVIEKNTLSEDVVRMVLEVPAIARKRKAGKFVLARVGEKGENIPLMIVDSDSRNGKRNRDHVYAGGDVVTGSATVILAMGAGRMAAQEIHKNLSPNL